MERTFSGDIPSVSIGAVKGGVALMSFMSFSGELTSGAVSGGGDTVATPQNRKPNATVAIGISNFKFGRRGTWVMGGDCGRRLCTTGSGTAERIDRVAPGSLP
jgi:hypothetical protein